MLFQVILGGCTLSEPVSRELGARCDEKADCAERCLAPGAAYPGGFCTMSCLDQRDCASNASCAAAAGGVCLFACVDDQACSFLGAGWRCVAVSLLPAGEGKVCLGS